MKNKTGQSLCFCVNYIFSPWQNTDAALLPTISYPAFAVDDDALYSQTLDKIVRKLRGKYGFKRFLRDGYRTANEDQNRRYYKPAEMKVGASGTPKGFFFLLFLFYLFVYALYFTDYFPHILATIQTLLSAWSKTNSYTSSVSSYQTDTIQEMMSSRQVLVKCTA